MNEIPHQQTERKDFMMPVSFGLQVNRPDDLLTVPLDRVLGGIAGGRWADEIKVLRALPLKSSEQTKAKRALPYFTPAGEFSRRSSGGLVHHSGLVAVDLDELGNTGAGRAMHVAMDDPHCACAFRSARGQGVRLIFRCPPCKAQAHKLAFRVVANHVREHYDIEPDPSGSDVARASFVTFDQGLWLNPSAEMLPGLATTTHKGIKPLCIVAGFRGLEEWDRESLAYGLGESYAHCLVKEDGTALTHRPLLDLGRALVVKYQRHGFHLTRSEIYRAFDSWWLNGKRLGLRYRCNPDVYRAELLSGVADVQQASWLPKVVNFWMRWTEHPEFPTDKKPYEKLAWVIRQHCAERQVKEFFLSARDAATITGTTFTNANATLHRLVAAGIIKQAGKRKHARHAQNWRLLSPLRERSTPERV